MWEIDRLIIYIAIYIVLQITVYLGKRDFVDHGDHIDPIGEYFLFCFCVFYLCMFKCEAICKARIVNGTGKAIKKIKTF